MPETVYEIIWKVCYQSKGNKWEQGTIVVLQNI
jgi:hypothetical protein